MAMDIYSAFRAEAAASSAWPLATASASAGSGEEWPKKDNRRKIYIKDFNPRLVSEADLRTYFGVFGPVETVEIESNGSSSNQASALLAFGAEGAVALALESQPHFMKGVSLKLGSQKEVNHAQVQDPRNQIFINLFDHKIISRSDIFEHFSHFGPVVDIHIPQNTRQSRTKKSFCFLTFKDPENVQAALRMAPHTIKGQSLNVTDVTKPMPSEGPKPMKSRDSRPRNPSGKGAGKDGGVPWTGAQWREWQMSRNQPSAPSSFPEEMDESDMQSLMMNTMMQMMNMMQQKGAGKGEQRSNPY